jgi:hypothetical protein
MAQTSPVLGQETGAMPRGRMVRRLPVFLTIASLLIPPGASRAGVIETILSCLGDDGQPLTLRQVASMIDCVDRELYLKVSVRDYQLRAARKPCA